MIVKLFQYKNFPGIWINENSHTSKDSIFILTHWGRVTHICVSKVIIIGSDNGLLPGQHQAIVWTSAEILLIPTLGTNSSKISSKMNTGQENAFGNVVCEMAAILSWPQHAQCVKWAPGLWNLLHLEPCYNTQIGLFSEVILKQGSFCVRTQPMRDNVTM